jgi:hypothetical protein
LANLGKGKPKATNATTIGDLKRVRKIKQETIQKERNKSLINREKTVHGGLSTSHT